MNKNYFFQISTDPDVDARKCAVAMACAAQAVADGHSVSVFFASHAVKLLHRDFIENMDKNVSQEPGFCLEILKELIRGAELFCSTGSQAVLGVTPENGTEVLVEGRDLNWSGPPGVIALSADADVSLSY